MAPGPIDRVLIGLVWLLTASLVPAYVGGDSFPPAEVAVPYFALGLVAVPVAVVVAYVLGSVAIRALRVLGVSV